MYCIYLYQLKLFNDPIHGSILLNVLEDAIINTPEFYRLRDIKQLGMKLNKYDMNISMAKQIIVIASIIIQA